MSETTATNTVVEAPSISSLKKKANSITNRRTLYAAGAGLIPFPIVDIAALLGVQIVMIRDIAKLYEINFKEQRVKSIITTLVGDLGAIGVMSGVKTIPVVGSIIGAFSTSLTGAAATYALGKVFTQHFDQGGTLLDFDPVKSRKYFQEAYDEGKLYVEDLSETSDVADEKTSWINSIGNKFKGNKTSSDYPAELADLRDKNEELKTMILQLQKSVDALKST